MALTPFALRAAHDLGLAAWFGGGVMGAVALNGASREVDEPTQRARVANAGWFRWAAVVPLAIGAHLLGAVGLSLRSGAPRGAALVATRVRLALVAVALLANLDSGRQGRIFAGAGDVPVATAVIPTSETPPEVAAAQRRLRVLQWVLPALAGGLLVVDAWQREHAGGTHVLPPSLLRRVQATAVGNLAD